MFPDPLPPKKIHGALVDITKNFTTLNKKTSKNLLTSPNMAAPHIKKKL
jgi:hypothetical protein